MSPEVLTDLAVEEIQSTAALEALRAEWAGLWSRCPSATPFQHPAWLLAWWRSYGGANLMALVLRQEDRLVGIAPLFVWNRPDAGERTILIMGTGITDYVDILLEPEFEESGTSAIFDHLDTERRRWDACQFEQLRAASPLRTGPIPADWADQVQVQEVCPVLCWRAGVRELEEVVPASLLKKLRYYRRRMEKEGQVEVRPSADETFDSCFDMLLRLHGARWSSKGSSGVLAGRLAQQFHREAARNLLREGILRLYVLYLDERPVAAYYGMFAHRCAYYYLAGFDPAFPSLSLGTQVIGYAIEQAIGEGATAFDFLRGREGYKYAWGAVDRPNYMRRLRHP